MEKIFLDTDLGYDCDDVGALSILNNFKKTICPKSWIIKIKLIISK